MNNKSILQLETDFEKENLSLTLYWIGFHMLLGISVVKEWFKAFMFELLATDLKKSIPGKEVLGLLVYRVRYNVVTKQLVARFSNSLLRSSRSGMMAGVLKSCYIDRQSNFGRGSVEYFAVLFQYILIATLLAS